MQTPDFAQWASPPLGPQDLRFLFEHFPVPGINAEQAAIELATRWNTLDSMLESRYVFDALQDDKALCLSVTPRLYFNVALRHSLPRQRNSLQRQVIHYLAHVLGLFARSERLYRVQEGEAQPYAYLVDLVQEAAQSSPERSFLVHSHIGNYAMFLAGLCKPWIDHRYTYKRRPVNLDYYCRMGRGYFSSASRHTLADLYGLRAVFRELAEQFDYYRVGLERLSMRQWVH